MMPATPPRSAEYYRQRAEDMRKEAMRAMSDDLRQLYSQAAKSWETLADMADRPEKKRAAR